MHPQSTRVPRICQHCERAFQVEAREVRRGHGRYCSARCRDDAHTRPFAERFWPKVNRHSGQFWNGTECWLWVGADNGKGYGRLYFAGRVTYVHRIAFILTYGHPLPGFFVCHHCDTPACIRPEHLFAATNQDNLTDMWRKGRARPHGKPQQPRR